ncbi:ABC-F family ATP-binding cassette domain-containing protein [Intrasporangium sp.]|uniref:ABC-F family ATP-binding cassette domain-containing protein n=1 Tax=Intrasporangium sp. TaxID=1925024 RepID=UPI00293B6A9B|nr:ABC-F family ATP-binding cassette domain-containing protein [Intrasporangium sp.]MDV3221030.1 ATP-binding cassette domain-containing protein [Intrasporangium sp.]
MPSLLTIADLDVAFGARTLFSGLDLTLADGDVIAVVGPNGSGKSTLMRTIVGELPIEHGSIHLAPRATTIAWLPQVLPDPEETLLGYARRRTGVTAAEVELEAATAALAADPDSDRIPLSADRYARALERWLALAGPDLEERLPAVAARVGLDVDPDRPLGSLSGGQAARASLVAVLLSHYDVLLLDEPTNNLDARGLDLMAEFVRSHTGPVLIASHDRHFLDAVATGIVELDLHQQQIRHYSGSYSDFVAERALRRSQAWEAYESYATARDSLVAQARQRQGWADRGRRNVAGGSEPDKHIREKHRARADRQAAKGARLERAAERLDAVDQPRREWHLRYAINEGRPSADVVASLSEATIRQGDFVLGPLSLVVGRGDRIGVTGDNGSGKTTLLSALLGRVPVASGRQSLGARVEVGVLDQKRRLLDDDCALLDVVRRELGPARGSGGPWPVADVRTLFAKFGLGADHVGRPARSLSMGERTRALMALFQGREVNTLVLDEPTNHLDVEAIEQLEAAVAAFSGTVLVVSHDESLLSGIRLSHRWHVGDGRVEVSTADAVLPS